MAAVSRLRAHVDGSAATAADRLAVGAAARIEALSLPNFNQRIRKQRAVNVHGRSLLQAAAAYYLHAE